VDTLGNLLGMAIYRVPVQLSWQASGAPGTNTFHVRTADVLQGNAELQLALDALEAFYTGLAGVFGFNATATLGEGIVDVSDPEEPRFQEMPNATVGLGASGGSPSPLAIAVGWQTALATRAGRGRTYLGPLATGVVMSDGVSLSSTQLTNIRAAAQGLVDASSTNDGWAVGVLSNAGTPIQVFRDFVGTTVKNKVAVLRSRRD
jgi:hypothetical protein